MPCDARAGRFERDRADRDRALARRRGRGRARRGDGRARRPGAARRWRRAPRSSPRLADGGEPAYGVSTGFGSLATVADPGDAPRAAAALAAALARGRAWAPPVEREVVRAMMLLRARTLAMGYSGARPVVAERSLALLNAGHHAGRARARLARRQRRPRPARPLRAGADRRGRGARPTAAPRRRPRRSRGRHRAARRSAAKEGLALINGTDGMLGMLVLAARRPRAACSGSPTSPRRCRSRRCSAPTAPSPRT